MQPRHQNPNPGQLQWEGLPFYPVSLFYQRHLGMKLQKLPVSVATDCPNRRGFKGMQTCIFCDEWGSSAYPEQRSLKLRQQLENRIKATQKKFNVPNYLAYFQAYTNTFMGVKRIQEAFDVGLSFPEVKGLVVGTRPDCLSKAVFDLWQEYSKRTFMSVEFGVQSFFDDQLEFLRRGHTGEQAIKGIRETKERTDVNLGVHLIFGLPGETDKHIVKTAEILSSLPVDNVKLHNLHVLKKTPLEDLYKSGDFAPISLEEYSDKVGLFLSYLRPDISVHRLAAVSSRWNELVAPQWTRYKMVSYQFILDRLNRKNIWQGMKYGSHQDSVSHASI